MYQQQIATVEKTEESSSTKTPPSLPGADLKGTPIQGEEAKRPPTPQEQEALLVTTKAEPQTVTQPVVIQKSEPSPELKQQIPIVAKKDDSLMVAKLVLKSQDNAESGLIGTPTKDTGAKRLVVYDFDANDQYRTVALILAEVLREEVFKLKQYILVNREDLQKILAEMALQQTGLINEKDAVLTGKGLAADQVVTGRLGLIGKLFLMQAKRVDVQTFSTLGLASLKFTEGHEDELLNKLPEFARTLVGLE